MNGHGGYFVGLNDGALLCFSFPTITDSNGDLSYSGLHIFLDLNGKSKPNKIGRDIFLLKSTSKNIISMPCPYTTRDEIKTACINNPTLIGWGMNSCCGKLIQYDSWQISPDYPW